MKTGVLNIMTKELKWRLGKLPTPDEVLKLVNDKVITKDEARDILFKSEDIEEKSEDELKTEKNPSKCEAL